MVDASVIKVRGYGIALIMVDQIHRFLLSTQETRKISCREGFKISSGLMILANSRLQKFKVFSLSLSLSPHNSVKKLMTQDTSIIKSVSDEELNNSELERRRNSDDACLDISAICYH